MHTPFDSYEYIQNPELVWSALKILFVCSGNAYRSPVAEALFKKLKPSVEADSAGIHPPMIPISGTSKKYLAKKNAEQHLKKVPEGLDQKTLNDYDLIIAMKLEHKDAILDKCPECEKKIVVWRIDDPYFLPPEQAEEVFDEIRQKVQELADSLYREVENSTTSVVSPGGHTRASVCRE